MKHVFPIFLIICFTVILGLTNTSCAKGLQRKAAIHDTHHLSHLSKLKNKKALKISHHAKVNKNKRQVAARDVGKGPEKIVLKNEVGYDKLSKNQVNAIVEKAAIASLKSNKLKVPFKKGQSSKKVYSKTKKVGAKKGGLKGKKKIYDK